MSPINENGPATPPLAPPSKDQSVDSRMSNENGTTKKEKRRSKPLGAIASLFGGGSHKRDRGRTSSGDEGLNSPRRSGSMQRSVEKQAEKGEKAMLAAKFEQGVKLQRLQSDLRAQQIETGEQRSHYGVLPSNIALKKALDASESHPTKGVDEQGGDGEEGEHPAPGPIANAAASHATVKKASEAGYSPLSTLTVDDVGQEKFYRLRLHDKRTLGSKLVFLILRDKIYTLQAVLHADENDVTRHMVRWAAHQIPLESIVVVRGRLQKPQEPLRSTSFADLELKVTELFVQMEPKDKPAFHLPNQHPPPSSRPANGGLIKSPRASMVSPDGSGSERSSLDVSLPTTGPVGEVLPVNKHLKAADPSTASSTSSSAVEVPGPGPPVPSLALRMANRVLDLRSPSSQAIFRINSAVCLAFRSFLGKQGFVEIHTPKLLGGASESGASVFGVNYFGRPAFLAQSPQLYKQMCVCAGFGRVFEIGPVFRAENSNTHRHLTEFTGLDLEMEIGDDYHEAMHLIDEMLKTIFGIITKDHARELDALRDEYGYQDFVWLDETPVLQFPDGIKMLVDSGYVEENGDVPTADEDLSTRAEIRLGRLVKEKYGTDFYILDKFPAGVRPFYTMPDPIRKGASNSFDIFVRGQEIISGGQRIHDADMLEDNIRRAGVEMKGLEEYVSAFRLAAPPHAGCGIGLERFVMLFLGLPDIRNASLYPRDPKSMRPSNNDELRHPEASTNPPPWKKRGHSTVASSEADLQPLEKLIANYGDTSNTSWLDARFTKWRHAETGAAIGYVKMQNDTCVIVGDPLCDLHQFPRVVKAFIDEVVRKEKLHPVWLLISDDLEKVLGETLHWRSLTCVAESRIPTAERRSSPASNEMERKIRQAKNSGLSIQTFGMTDEVPANVKDEVDAEIKKWLDNRKGKQVHLTEVTPWRDEAHRAYYIVRDADEKVCALVIMCQLSANHGLQIKWALDFPGAPSGAIEYAISTAVGATPNVPHSFGASATSHLSMSRSGKGLGNKALAATYEGFVKSLHLLNKGDFRKKFGAVEEPLYIAYHNNMSPRKIKAIIDFFGYND